MPPYPTVPYLSFEAPRFDLRSDWTAGTATLVFRELTSSAMQIARYFTIFLAETFGVSSLLSPPKRGNGSTASRQLSEVKPVPAQVALRWVTTLENPGCRTLSLFALRLATLGMCQPPRELNPAPQRSLCRGGDPVGNRTHDHKMPRGHPRSRSVFFGITFFKGNFHRQKRWDSPQLRLGIRPPAQLGGAMRRSSANPLPGPLSRPLPLGR